MNFYDFLERLQRRPDEQKRKILMAVAGIFAVALLTIWVVKLKGELAGQPGLFSLESGRQEKPSDSPDKSSVLSPLASLGRGLALFVSDLREKSEGLLSKTTEIVAEDSQGPPSLRPAWRLPRVE